MSETDVVVASVGDTVRFRIWDGPYSVVSEYPVQLKRESNRCTRGTGIVTEIKIADEEISKGTVATIGNYLLRVIDIDCGDISVHQRSTVGDELWVNHGEIIGVLIEEESMFRKKEELR